MYFCEKYSNFVVMKTEADIIIAHPASNDKLKALKAFMKALNIKFEVRQLNKSPYDPEFVDMVLLGDEDIKQGKGKKITIEELDALWK